jgi:uncharacterized membrane protein YjgN (DUF898 family)
MNEAQFAANEAPAEAPSAPQVHAFSFAGEAREYFRIWIVNLFLTVVTLGVYSAWAKVRKKRYLYGNTWVADANFDYHGNPVAILKGRIIAVSAFLVYTYGGHYVPRLGTAVLLVFAIAAPWLIVRTFQFNAFNSSYRNLRFGFHGTYGEALRAVFPFALSALFALLVPEFDPENPPRGAAIFLLFLPSLPFLLLYPYVIGSLKRLHVNRSSFGGVPFVCTAGIGAFYKIYVLAFVLLFVGTMFFGCVAAVTVPAAPAGWIAIPFVYLLVGAVIIAFTRSRVGNLTFNTSSLAGRVRFASSLSARKLAWIYFVNLAGIAVSLGLLVPWAVIRTARYRVSCLAIECSGDLEGFLAEQLTGVGATGDQMGEFFDVDLSL